MIHFMEIVYFLSSFLRPCLDVVVFTSIHVCWCGLRWNVVQVQLQSTSTHVDWCESDNIQTRQLRACLVYIHALLHRAEPSKLYFWLVWFIAWVAACRGFAITCHFIFDVRILVAACSGCKPNAPILVQSQFMMLLLVDGDGKFAPWIILDSTVKGKGKNNVKLCETCQNVWYR